MTEATTAVDAAAAAAAASAMLSKRVRDLQDGVNRLCQETFQLLSEDLSGLARRIASLTAENQRLRSELSDFKKQSSREEPPSLLTTKKWTSEKLPPPQLPPVSKQRLSDSPRKTVKRKLTLVMDQPTSPSRSFGNGLAISSASHHHQQQQQQQQQQRTEAQKAIATVASAGVKRFRQATLLQAEVKRRVDLSAINSSNQSASNTKAKPDGWLKLDSDFNAGVNFASTADPLETEVFVSPATAAAATDTPIQDLFEQDEGEETVATLGKEKPPQPAHPSHSKLLQTGRQDPPLDCEDDEGSETIAIHRTAASAVADADDSPVFNRSDHLPTPPPPPPTAPTAAAVSAKYNLADYNRLPEPANPNYRQACVVRRRDDRMALDAHCCPDCEAWFADLSPESRRQRLRQCGRHRDNQRPPLQAPNFFAIEMPPTPEPAPTQCMKVGKRRHRPLRLLAKEHQERKK